ncbi:hypothetical protein [uncultured Chryseobacterium sp.]|uniref:hypothetical protein n=1 Tax=uncultured Chryseobacterium sp. TaxID=259322 RepID=UPI0025D8D6B5|nr:hypothetical protein [uncultured Chryseobacterium sp.]
MSKTIKIYCEGTNSSFDCKILNLIISDIIGKILLQPIGSKKGAGPIINYDFPIPSIVKPDFFFFFRDRDFDLAVPNNEELTIQDNKDSFQNVIGQRCLSYRCTIENYLFDEKILFEFLKKKNLLLENSIGSETDVKNKMIKAAKNIKYYQAIRHTLGVLRTNLDLGTSFLNKNKSSGDLPNDLTLEYCKNKALEKIKNIKDETKKWDNFEIELQKFLMIFNETIFYNNLEFLTWFQGKDFATALQRELQNFSKRDLNEFYQFSLDQFNYSKFADLVQLKNLIQEKINE